MTLFMTLLLSAWTTRVTVDAMDDTKSVSALSAPESATTPPEGFLMVMCNADIGGVLGFGTPGNDWIDHDFLNNTTGRLRVDDHPAVPVTWIGNQLQIAITAPGNEVFRQMIAGDVVKVEIPIINYGPKVYTISLAGAGEAIKRVAETCPKMDIG